MLNDLDQSARYAAVSALARLAEYGEQWQEIITTDLTRSEPIECLYEAIRPGFPSLLNLVASSSDKSVQEYAAFVLAKLMPR